MGRVVNFRETGDIPPPELAVHAAMSKVFQSGSFGYPIPVTQQKECIGYSESISGRREKTCEQLGGKNDSAYSVIR